MKIKICPNCGSHNLETAVACANKSCGAALSADNTVELNDNAVHLVADTPESDQVKATPESLPPSLVDQLVDPIVQEPFEPNPPARSTGSRLFTSCLVYWFILACLADLVTFTLLLTYHQDAVSGMLILLGVSLVVPLIFSPFWVMGAFWVWPLVDCIKNEPSTGNEKIVWTVVILLANFLGGLLYLIIRRPERINRYGK